jgi:hypothetical protein
MFSQKNAFVKVLVSETRADEREYTKMLAKDATATAFLVAADIFSEREISSLAGVLTDAIRRIDEIK